MPTRRNFLKNISGALAFVALSGETLALATRFVSHKVAYATKGVLSVIRSLQAEGSNVVLKMMNGNKYKRNPLVHYPFDGGILDEETGYRVFFHAHREKEYGHFHTFYEKPNGDLVHLIMVSMDKKGYPIQLSTVNRWVTGDVFVKADELKEYFLKFKMNDSLFSDKRIGVFVRELFTEYKTEILGLIAERDNTIRGYVKKNAREPFGDREVEILSSTKIEIKT
ncbi:MAG: hypothetical protein COA57_02180 [Flavobacteriales bacterium]|nr:hypothetical protein [Bacteroidales bacterium AH-315-I05]PCJ89428.1 MAG: hypothetical protein COA57_02180 [Flavobacteriales bacterium]